MILKSVLIFTIVIFISAISLHGIVNATTGEHPDSETPGSLEAYVFSLHGSPLDTVGVFIDRVSEHGYSVTSFIDAPGADDDPQDATVTNFLATSRAGILYILTNSSSSFGPLFGTGCGDTPCFMVERYGDVVPSVAMRDTALTNYLNSPTFNTDDLVPCGDLNDLGIGICITEQGIRNHWEDNDTIVFFLSCESIHLANAFEAREFFGYRDEGIAPCAYRLSEDTSALFGLMHGDTNNGETRAASLAFNNVDPGNWWNDPLEHVHKVGTLDTVLSPAVRYNSLDGIEVSVPDTIPSQIAFDARMDTTVDPAEVLEATGCDIAIINPQWTSEFTLDFTISISSEGGASIRVLPDKAIAENNLNNLDGNTDPRNTDHVGPNDDPFQTGFVCGEIDVTIVTPTQITIIKRIINNNGGTAAVSDFTFELNSESLVQPIPVFAGVPKSVIPDTYEVTEDGPLGYTVTFSGDCSSEGKITIEEGQQLRCIVINDDIPPSQPSLGASSAQAGLIISFIVLVATTIFGVYSAFRRR